MSHDGENFELHRDDEDLSGTIPRTPFITTCESSTTSATGPQNNRRTVNWGDADDEMDPVVRRMTEQLDALTLELDSLWCGPEARPPNPGFPTYQPDRSNPEQEEPRERREYHDVRSDDYRATLPEDGRGREGTPRRESRFSNATFRSD
eukprot:2887240-Rhodomonas_salina.1